MIRSGRAPTDRSERMIYNNYLTMQALHRRQDEPLSPRLLFEIHHEVTRGTLDDDSAVGRLRGAHEVIHVVDRSDGTVLHTPPPAAELDARVDAMCAFAGGGDGAGRGRQRFLHPVLRSIILHFWLAYESIPLSTAMGRAAGGPQGQQPLALQPRSRSGAAPPGLRRRTGIRGQFRASSAAPLRFPKKEGLAGAKPSRCCSF